MSYSSVEILKTKHSFGETIRTVLDIIKIKITVLVSFTTGLGYIIAANSFSITLLYVVLGIFFLACSSAALNHLQEKDFDALMQRTSNRPLPSGGTSSGFVFGVALFFIISGILILVLKVNYQSLIIGLNTLIWYNAIYTPLKRRSAFAVIPGSLVGALPPLAGFAAVEGFHFDIRILYISFYFFLWQIPHFWLLLLVYGEDYKQAGYPVLNEIFDGKKLKVFTFLWIVISLIFALGIPFSGIVNSMFAKTSIIALTAIVLVMSVIFIFSELNRKNIFRTFISINIFTLLIILFISLEKFYIFIK